MKQNRRKYILVLIGMCGLLASSVGVISNVAGLFFTSVAEELNILKGSVSMTLTVTNLCFALGGVFALRLINENNLRPVLIAGTACIAGPTALLGLSDNILIMYVLNAVRGFAGGILGFVLVTTVINNWFYVSSGLAASAAMSCSGLAGALLSPLLSAVIEYAGWRAGYFVSAAVILLFNLPAILFLPALDPRTKGILPYGCTVPITGSTQTDKGDHRGTKVSGVLFAAVFAYAFLACSGTALPQHFPGITGFWGLSASTGAMMLSAGMIANSTGKIIFGALADRFGAKISMLLYSVLAAAGTLLIWFVHKPAVMYAGACMYGMIYSLGIVAVVILTKDMFGLENYSRTYPVISLAGTVGSAVTAALIGFIFDLSGSYTAALALMLSMILVNIMIILGCYRYRGK
ncbi:MAG: MFS transporter [Solobacterium sp.]|nr:MFS transporter [Solobacterium sp.]